MSNVRPHALKNIALRKVRRPLCNAHWSLTPILIVVWLLVLWAQPCKEPPYYAEAVLGTFTICLAFWLNHLRLAPILHPRNLLTLALGTTYDLLLFILALIITTIPLAIILPAYSCITPRTKVAELLLSTNSIRDEITRRISEAQTLSNAGTGLTVPQGKRVQWSLVTPDGILFAATDDPPSILILKPSLSAGEVQWQCNVFPITYAPFTCK
jgi:hypothetical protein